ncbi:MULTISPECIES: hypothetical protein [unclassified Phyllobacterium]|uniref:hypothetical protein n=1 Tax=unclassified Phyllobacterium TaxID=2638441 RepID=UPI003012A49F
MPGHKAHPSSGIKPAYADNARSRVTNGKEILPGVDGRTHWAKRFRDLISIHIDDLGGVANCSEAEKSIIRRACTLTVELERLEVRFALAGEASEGDLDLYSRLSNTLRRLLDVTGLQRRSRDITPTIDEYMRREAAE